MASGRGRVAIRIPCDPVLDVSAQAFSEVLDAWRLGTFEEFSPHTFFNLLLRAVPSTHVLEDVGHDRLQLLQHLQPCARFGKHDSKHALLRRVFVASIASRGRDGGVCVCACVHVCMCVC